MKYLMISLLLAVQANAGGLLAYSSGVRTIINHRPLMEAYPRQDLILVQKKHSEDTSAAVFLLTFGDTNYPQGHNCVVATLHYDWQNPTPVDETYDGQSYKVSSYQEVSCN